MCYKVWFGYLNVGDIFTCDSDINPEQRYMLVELRTAIGTTHHVCNLSNGYLDESIWKVDAVCLVEKKPGVKQMYEKAMACVVRNHRSSSDFTDKQLERIEEILNSMEEIGPANDLNWRDISGLGQDLYSVLSGR